MSLPPWAEGPFELIVHGELHFREGDDFDRRMALISFDNAIEVSITTYLSLHPIHRNNRSYDGALVVGWLRDFHTKLSFLELECTTRGIGLIHDRASLVFYHQLRNKQYHEGTPASPNWSHLRRLREASLWVFSTLFEINDIEQILEEYIIQLSQPRLASDVPQRDPQYDDAIDSAFGLFEFADNVYLASEILHSVDPRAYKELAIELMASDRPPLRAVS